MQSLLNKILFHKNYYTKDLHIIKKLSNNIYMNPLKIKTYLTRYILYIYQKDYIIFKQEFNLIFNKDIIKNKKTLNMYPYYKLYNFIFKIIQFLKKDNFILKKTIGIRKYNFLINEVIISLDIKVIFTDLIYIFMKNSYYNLLLNPIVKVKRSDILKDLNDSLLSYLIKLILSTLKKHKYIKKHSNYFRKIYNHIKKDIEYKDLDFKSKWYFKIHDISINLINILEITSFIVRINKEISNYDNKVNNNVVYSIKNNINIQICSKNILLSRDNNKKYSKNYIYNNMKFDNNFNSEIRISKLLLNTLNIIRLCSFKLNTDFLELIEKIDKNTSKNFNTPNIYRIKKYFRTYLIWSKSLYKNLLDEKIENTNNKPFKTMHKLDNNNKSKLENFVYKLINLKKKNLLCLLDNKILLNIYIYIMSLYKNNNIYFNVQLDNLINLKVLSYFELDKINLINFIVYKKNIRLKKLGLLHIMEVYYIKNTMLKKKFKEYVKEKKPNFIDLKLYFANNRLDTNTVYHKLLENELYNIFFVDKKYTSLLLKLNLSDCFFFLLGILTKNEHLLHVLNTDGNNEECVNSYLNTKSIDFLKSKNIIKSINELNNLNHFINNHSNLHKYLLLYIFSKNKNKSIEFLKKKYKNFYTEKIISLAEIRILKHFSSHYLNIINSAFPNLLYQLSLLIDFQLKIIENNKFLYLKTLDKCILKYYPLSNKYIKNKYFNVLTSNNQQYRTEIKQFSNIFENKDLLLDILINSLQSSLYRILIYEFYNKTKIPLLFFNDTFLIHPNHAGKFKLILTEVCTKLSKQNLVQDLVLIYL